MPACASYPRKCRTFLDLARTLTTAQKVDIFGVATLLGIAVVSEFQKSKTEIEIEEAAKKAAAAAGGGCVDPH